MDIETFRDYCLSLDGTTEEMKWGNLCFLIEAKIFVLVNFDNGNRIVLKCDPEEFDQIVARDGLKQAFHFAKRHWFQMEDLEVLSDKELKNRVQASRALVLTKLPKKIQTKYL